MKEESNAHAKNYLMKFSLDQNSWLQLLIFDTLGTNGNLTKEQQDKIYSCLKNDENIDLPRLSTTKQNHEQKIVFKKLEHISGVNALASKQTIKFSDDLTVLYGLNGAGKSGYFKILNEMVGGNEHKKILVNIHEEQPERIQAQLTLKNGKEQIFDGSERGFEFLTACKVFDSSYLTGLLSQRTQTELVLKPLGLHLFKYIADEMDKCKNRLDADADQLKESKPSISYEKFSDQLKNEFESHDLSEETIKSLKDLFVFSDEKGALLKSKQGELDTLEQTNVNDRLAVLNTERSELQKITEFLKKKESLEAMFEEVTKLLEEKQETEKENRKRLERITVLKELPLSSTNEWKAFISAGATLKKEHKQQINDKICIYCNQPLQEDAFKLVQAYAEYLGDKTEGELKIAKNNLNNAKNQLKETSITLDISDSFKQAHKDTLLENTDILFSTALSEAQKSIKDLKSYLLSVSSEKNAEKPKNTIHPQFSEWIDNRLKKNSNEIETHKASVEEKNKKIETLKNKINILLEEESISEQKAKIENWLEVDKEEKALRKKGSKINTNAVTKLSNTAHDNLLTTGLNKAFKNELKELDYKNLEVNLVKVGGGKGSHSTKLTLKNNNSILNILSEGEQKAVGLALFIAESSIQKSQDPIILDDPVNSLDHEIAANFANRLLSLGNQLIIFNHNRLFQDAFETAPNSHTCKTFDSACSKKQGKHILVYSVNSEGESRKGVIDFYNPNRFTRHISDVKSELKKSPFNEHLKISALLRKAVECLIDETVLNGIIPTKYSNKKSKIEWNKFKELKCTPEDIEKIRKVYYRVSGSCLHNGMESENNPITVEEFQLLVADLESVVDRKNIHGEPNELKEPSKAENQKENTNNQLQETQI